MWRRKMYRALGAVSALCLLCLGIALTQPPASAAAPGAAWCYEDGLWMVYAEGVPGSATPEAFTACLRRSAEQGYVKAFEAQLVEGGALIDVGDSSLFWTLPRLFSLPLTITAYDDHIVFEDSCERAVEVRGAVARMTVPGYPCLNHERIRLTPEQLTGVDFTIYVAQRQFLIDATEGWYHIVRDKTGWNEDQTPRGQVTFRGVNGSVWVTTALDYVGSSIYDVHHPVANTAWDAQQYHAYDWETRVQAEPAAVAFGEAGIFLLPDWEAYWDEVRGWLDAIMDDLFHGRVEPVRLRVLDAPDCVAYADISAREIVTSCGGVLTILHEFAHVVVGHEEDAHGGEFVATLIMLWERYMPGFDAARARELTQRFGVKIGSSVAVEPVSYRTQIVRDLLAKTAPVLASDWDHIDSSNLLSSVVLEVGRSYQFPRSPILTSSATLPGCLVTEAYSDGSTYLAFHLPHGSFTVNPGGAWNGIEISTGTGAVQGSYTMFISGTPTTAGRIRVKVATHCPDGYAQEPRFVGYSEVIVVDPDDE